MWLFSTCDDLVTSLYVLGQHLLDKGNADHAESDDEDSRAGRSEEPIDSGGRHSVAVRRAMKVVNCPVAVNVAVMDDRGLWVLSVEVVAN
jgi:hypothetical protein